MNILKMDRAMGKETSYGKKTKQYHIGQVDYNV